MRNIPTTDRISALKLAYDELNAACTLALTSPRRAKGLALSALKHAQSAQCPDVAWSCNALAGAL